MAKAKNFFNEAEQKQIIEAIKIAEKNTSGEIRLHLEDTCKSGALKRAEQLFSKLKMQKTGESNGILFYLAVKSRDFAIVGDVGIHAKVGQEFWDRVIEKAINQFKTGQFSKGLEDAILECGMQLKKYFPYQSNDTNELSDEISFNK